MASTNPSDTPFIIIDGSQGEGGGQILRNAVSYAAILQVPLKIHSIRAKRSKPGLAAQHVAAISLAAALGGGTLEGAILQSTEIQYTPPTAAAAAADAPLPILASIDTKKTHQQQVYEGIIATAGSICLLLQAALPVALLGKLPWMPQSPILLDVKGGTNATMAPQYDYWERIFLPTFQNCFLKPKIATGDTTTTTNTTSNGTRVCVASEAVTVSAKVLKRGYFPKGGGHVQVSLLPNETATIVPLSSFDLTERGHVVKIHIRAYNAGQTPDHAASRVGMAAQERLQTYFQKQQSPLDDNLPPIPDIELEVVREPNAVGSGLGLLIVATTSTGCLLGGSALSNKRPPNNKKSKQQPKKQKQHQPKQNNRSADDDPKMNQHYQEVGHQAAQELIEALEEGGCVDEWLQDQLILYMAMAEGTSTMLTGSLTLHTQTAIQVAKQMVPGVVFEVTRLTDLALNNKASSIGETKHNVASNEKPVYGRNGKILGQHRIRCHGIGYNCPA